MTALAGSPDSDTFNGFAAASLPPRSTTQPRSWCLYGLRRPCPYEAAMLCAASLPCRCACWAVIVQIWPGRARSGTAAASPQAYTSGKPGTLRYSSTTRRPCSVRRPSSATNGSGRTPTHQTRVQVGHVLAVGERAPRRRWPRPPRCPSARRPPPAQHPVGGVRHPLVQLGQHPGRDVEQHPAGADREPGALGDQRVGEELPVRGDLGAGVAGADHHEGGAGLLLGRVLGLLGQLDLPDDVVVQVERLGQAAEAVGVLGHAGDGQQLVDAADGEHQPVVREPAAVALRLR